MKLALGTVQFGGRYGLLNADGQTQPKEIKQILSYAMRYNIETLDTASQYGCSELILGKIGVENWEIITKTSSLSQGVDSVLHSFYQSLRLLEVLQIYGLLIHDFDDVEHVDFDKLLKQLYSLQEQGMIQKIGFSVYNPGQIDFLLANFDFDIIQVPINIFDQRLIRGGYLKRLKDKKIEIHARSIFLQGILLNANRLPNYFLKWEEAFKLYSNFMRAKGVSLLESALSFVLNVQELDKVVVGVENQRQLQEIIQSSSRDIDIDFTQFAIYDEDLLNPSRWAL